MAVPYFQQLGPRVSAAFGLPGNRLSGWHAGGLQGSMPRDLRWGAREAGRADGEAELWGTWNRGPTRSCGVSWPCRVVPIEAKEQASPTEGLPWATPLGIRRYEAVCCTEAIPRAASCELPAASTPGSRDECRSWVVTHSYHDSIWLSQDWTSLSAGNLWPQSMLQSTMSEAKIQTVVI